MAHKAISSSTIASEEQLAKAAKKYPGDWWRHRDGLRQPVLVVVGEAGSKEPPPQSSSLSPVWESPDGYGPTQVLSEHGYDVWYQDGTGRLMRYHATR